MKTLKPILLCLLTFNFLISLSQNENLSLSLFFAGQIENTFNYHSNYQGSPSNLYLDLNGDEIDDVYFKVESETSYGGEVITTTFSIIPLNQNLISTSQNSTSVIEGLNFGDSIQPSNIHWSAGEKIYFIGENIESYGSYEWESYLNDGYFSILIPNETNTLYSWVLITVEHFSFHSELIIEAFTTWQYCSNTIDLGEDQVISISETLLLDAGNGYDNYLWNTGETTQSITVAGASLGIGNWIYSIIAAQGNCTYYDTINIEVVDNIGISDIYMDHIRVGPNPFKNIITIKNPEEKKITIEISDVSGKAIYRISTSGNIFKLNLEVFQPGLYFCQIYSINSNKVYKLLKY